MVQVELIGIGVGNITACSKRTCLYVELPMEGNCAFDTTPTTENVEKKFEPTEQWLKVIQKNAFDSGPTQSLRQATGSQLVFYRAVAWGCTGWQITIDLNKPKPTGLWQHTWAVSRQAQARLMAPTSASTTDICKCWRCISIY